MRGIDISHWQQGLDVGNILMDGLEFVILKITDGGAYTDQSAASNYTKANTAGIPVGGYCYSHAVNAPQARAEAAHILDTIMGFPMPLGLYLDVEKPEQLALPHDVLMNVLIAWCDAIRAAGYIPGVYGSEGTLWAKISPEELPDDVLIWVAHYGKEPAIPCDIWQSGQEHAVSGYDGEVDINDARSQRFKRLVNSVLINTGPGDPGEQGEPGVVPDACPIFPPGPSVMCIQMVMSYNGYWGTPDGQKTPEFFSALRTFVDDMEKC